MKFKIRNYKKGFTKIKLYRIYEVECRTTNYSCFRNIAGAFQFLIVAFAPSKCLDCTRKVMIVLFKFDDMGRTNRMEWFVFAPRPRVREAIIYKRAILFHA